MSKKTKNSSSQPNANGDSTESQQSSSSEKIIPNPPQTNNAIVIACGVLMVGWLIYLLVIAILAN